MKLRRAHINTYGSEEFHAGILIGQNVFEVE